MYESIEPALANRWAMFYHAKWPIHMLTPVCDLPRCVEQCNRNLADFGKNLQDWPLGDRYQIARLLRVNWIYNRLDQEPIRKPILAHRVQDQFVVDCGDTRLMALGLKDPTSTIGVVIVDTIESADLYQDWIRIRTDQELREQTGFAPDAGILVRTSDLDHTIEWMEIGDMSTAHHLHDFDQRLAMMQNYLDSQIKDFRFDPLWAASAIDWSATV